MTLSTRLAVCFVGALACAGPLRGQEKTDKNLSEEDSRLVRIIERWVERHESERDYVVRTIARGDAKLGDDFEQWYKLLGGDDEGWERSRIQRGSIRDIFDRVAWRLESRVPSLTREQVLNYAREYWRKDKSPPWRAAPSLDTEEEARDLFRRFDRNRDGYLSEFEMSPALHDDRKRWDKNSDGWINLYEYRFHFVRRLDALFRKAQQNAKASLPELPLAAPADPDRPTVMRPGKLPNGLPAWFEPVDQDGDGQIALYEWRRAGWPIGEFSSLDLNDDGVLEPNEILRLLATTDRAGERPYAYLMQKRVEEGAAAGSK